MKRAKHIDVRDHYFKDCITSGSARIGYKGSATNTSSGFAKPLDRTLFDMFRAGVFLRLPNHSCWAQEEHWSMRVYVKHQSTTIRLAYTSSIKVRQFDLLDPAGILLPFLLARVFMVIRTILSSFDNDRNTTSRHGPSHVELCSGKGQGKFNFFQAQSEKDRVYLYYSDRCRKDESIVLMDMNEEARKVAGLLLDLASRVVVLWCLTYTRIIQQYLLCFLYNLQLMEKYVGFWFQVNVQHIVAHYVLLERVYKLLKESLFLINGKVRRLEKCKSSLAAAVCIYLPAPMRLWL